MVYGMGFATNSHTLPALMGWPLLALPFQLGFVVLGLLMVMWTMDDEVWSEVDDEFGYSLSTSEQLVVMPATWGAAQCGPFELAAYGDRPFELVEI